MRLRPVLPHLHVPSAALAALFLLTHLLLKAVFFSRPFLVGVAYPLERATGGLVTQVLLCGLVEWGVLVGGVAWAVGRLSPAALGLDRRSLADAWFVLVGLWALTQWASAGAGWASGSLALHHGLTSGTLASQVGLRLEAIFGSGLIEEVIYRGFLQTQVFLLLRRRLGRAEALTGAVVVAALYFGINHVPAAMAQGLGGAEAAGYVFHCALVGAMLGALYVRTGNLFVAGGAHALLNDPLALFDAPVSPPMVALVAVCLLLLVWPWLGRRFGGVFTLGELEGRPAL